MKKIIPTAIMTTLLLSACTSTDNIEVLTGVNDQKISVTTAWDKVFAEDLSVTHKKVVFHNRYGINLVGDLYIPKNVSGKLPAVAISGPYGAVKEQVSGFYAQKLASYGFITLAFDPSYTGESGGLPRDISSSDINTEDFMAAVDYLLNREDIDGDKVSIVGICGFGGFALNAATMDTRLKSVVTVTMYDMTRVTKYGYFDKQTADERFNLLKSLNAQRTEDYKNNSYKKIGGVPEHIDESTPQFVVDYHNFYKEKQGYHERSVGSNDGFTTTSSIDLIGMPILNNINEINPPVLMVHGEKAHSRYFSEDIFKQLTSNKQLLIVKDANHTDLYYKENIIPFDEIANFIKTNM